ncbi:molybdate ABC transporter substrate-binding protein [Mycobacterium talmoniae]|uniref:Molybdate ABC transporter substrate-binding protein n=1 Tax=Mycobacterium talmoniae TaxID=1858794 RepID=A0A1S1NJH4_9MYCO|nr:MULTISPECIES: molybdate ABC transporter substrate-binding protein [Mycobacterium]OHV03983.1 molybdate ABC transporter substrate-binding protein [Mycobacterium talmoniae]PQM48433.1 Molybdate-binding protein [Mycobacterium talmoniae]TDH57180.1 molybdate ABC transporter substrate-binding protein [Mycobacterium eburneum]
MRRVWVVAMVLATALAGLVGCGSKSPAPSITVFAAASLKPAFTEIGQRFQTDNPGARIEFNFAGSSELATQLTQGVTADVFASANTAQMDKVAQAGLLAGAAVPFAANTLVIVTAPGNPKKVASFADLAKPGLSVVVCQQPVPCGSATHKVEDSTGVQVAPVSEEPDVTDVLNKVITGQADAGLVYITDALNAGDKVTAVRFPEAAGAVNIYPMAVLKNAPQSGLAQRFVDLVTGPAGQKILDKAGFAKT